MFEIDQLAMYKNYISHLLCKEIRLQDPMRHSKKGFPTIHMACNVFCKYMLTKDFRRWTLLTRLSHLKMDAISKLKLCLKGIYLSQLRSNLFVVSPSKCVVWCSLNAYKKSWTSVLSKDVYRASESQLSHKSIHLFSWHLWPIKPQ